MKTVKKAPAPEVVVVAAEAKPAAKAAPAGMLADALAAQPARKLEEAAADAALAKLEADGQLAAAPAPLITYEEAQALAGAEDVETDKADGKK